jgi:Glycosyltransferase family 87
VALAASMWFYVRHVLVPLQKSYAVTHQQPRGNLSDLYPRWLGARELLLHGRDPYSAAITREIQIGYYGRPLDANRPNDPKDQEGFAYPVYVVFLLAPTVDLPFSLVQTAFYWLLIGVVVVTMILCFRAIQWRTSILTIATAIALALSSFPVIQSIALRQLSVLVAGLIALAFLLVVKRHLALAGLVLAIASIKPQLVVPFVLWLTIWTISGWRERKGFLAGFSAGMAVLFAGAQWVLPGWVIEFYHAVVAYRKYTGGVTPADVLFGSVLGAAANVLMIAVAVWICWQARSKDEKSLQFAFASCFTLVTTVAIIPIFAPYNQLLLFPGFLFLVQHRRALRAQRLWQKVLLGAAITLVCWQWIACIVLTAIYCFFSQGLVDRIWQVPFYVSVALPMILMCLLYVWTVAVQSKTASPETA